MNKFIDRLIEDYTSKPKRKQIMKKEIEDFMRFYIAVTEDREKLPFIDTEVKEDKEDEYTKKPVSKNNHKYKQMRIAGLVFIEQNKKQIFEKISEAVSTVHHRSPNYQSILSGKETGFGGRRSRRLV
tara:strand:- start:178 stop:558 length:381 start_codon:yes stop_codon:yes gene_type:complete